MPWLEWVKSRMAPQFISSPVTSKHLFLTNIPLPNKINCAKLNKTLNFIKLCRMEQAQHNYLQYTSVFWKSLFHCLFTPDPFWNVWWIQTSVVAQQINVLCIESQWTFLRRALMWSVAVFRQPLPFLEVLTGQRCLLATSWGRSLPLW